MARIAGVDIPRDKRVVISLTYVRNWPHNGSASLERGWCF